MGFAGFAQMVGAGGTGVVQSRCAKDGFVDFCEALAGFMFDSQIL